MTTFVTGSTGYIGSAVVAELVRRGHVVTGLTRSAENGDVLRALGAEPVMGDIRDPSSYRAAAESARGLVHIAVAEPEERAAADRVAVETLLGAARRGGAESLVYTSGCFVLGETGSAPAHEDAPIDAAPDLVAWRALHEQLVLKAGGRGLATSVIRPGMVYGGKDGAFGDFFASAVDGGAARHVGEGENRWSPVYRGDAARLYRMVVERSGQGIFHCVEPAARVADLAAAASQAAGAGGATHSVPLDEAREDMGALADALVMDQVLGCRRATAFGWAPEHAPFLESAEAVYMEWHGPAGDTSGT